MGRTLDTYRTHLESEQSLWLKSVKRTNYENFAKEVLSNAQYYADAITFWSNGQIKEKFLFSILFAQYKELKQLEKELKIQ